MAIYKLPGGSIQEPLTLSSVDLTNITTSNVNAILVNTSNITSGNIVVTTLNLNTTAALTMPIGSTDQRPASPANGMMRFNNTTNTFEGYKAGAWGSIGGAGATGGGSDEMFYLNGINVTASYSIPSGKNAMTAGPVTVNDGVTVTVPDGSAWTIV